MDPFTLNVTINGTRTMVQNVGDPVEQGSNPFGSDCIVQ